MRFLLVEKQMFIVASRICDDRSFVVHVDTTGEALSILRHETFDLVVLDVTSFPEDGFAFIRRLRAARNDTPLVALTGQHATDRVRALSLGADDAISQPVDLADLRARIAAVSRRHKGFGQSLIQVGDLSLSLESREVRFRGIRVGVTAKEYMLLELLMLRQGQVVTREMCLNQLYGGMDEPGSKRVNVFVCKVRQKLSAVGARKMLATAWGQGYVIRAIGEAPVAGEGLVARGDGRPLRQTGSMPSTTMGCSQNSRSGWASSSKSATANHPAVSTGSETGTRE